MAHPAQLPSTMRAAVLHKFADTPDADGVRAAVTVEEKWPVPTELASDEVLVRVEAAALNALDARIATGSVSMFANPAPPYVPCLDVAGVVVRAGSGCTRLRAGQRVFGCDENPAQGVCSEYAVVKEGGLTEKPDSLSFAEAATFGVAGQTALQACLDAGVGAGHRVLVLGGSSGVGSAAVQIARGLGAAYVASTCSARNADMVRGLGVDRVVDYKTERWWEELAPQAGADGADGADGAFDAVIDCVGDGPDAWDRARLVLKPSGSAYATVAMEPFDEHALEKMTVWRIAKMMGRAGARRLRTMFGGPAHRLVLVEADHAVIARVPPLMRPVVTRVYALEDAAEAMALVASGRAAGKLVIGVGNGCMTTGAEAEGDK